MAAAFIQAPRRFEISFLESRGILISSLSQPTQGCQRVSLHVIYWPPGYISNALPAWDNNLQPGRLLLAWTKFVPAIYVYCHSVHFLKTGRITSRLMSGSPKHYAIKFCEYEERLKYLCSFAFSSHFADPDSTTQTTAALCARMLIEKWVTLIPQINLLNINQGCCIRWQNSRATCQPGWMHLPE